MNKLVDSWRYEVDEMSYFLGCVFSFIFFTANGRDVETWKTKQGNISVA